MRCPCMAFPWDLGISNSAFSAHAIGIAVTFKECNVWVPSIMLRLFTLT